MCFNFVYYYPKENGIIVCMEARAPFSICRLGTKSIRNDMYNPSSSSNL